MTKPGALPFRHSEKGCHTQRRVLDRLRCYTDLGAKAGTSLLMVHSSAGDLNDDVQAQMPALCYLLG